MNKSSLLMQIMGEATDMAEVYAKLQIQDWSPTRFADTLREARKLPAGKKGKADSKPLIRLAALCIVGAWIIQLEG